MGTYINRGNGSFARARKSQIYVDKTGLLAFTNEVLDTEQCYICNSRPRRFGKSMAAGMLAIKKYKSESALNNFREFTMTNPKRLSAYIGFTEEEVQALCKRYDMDFAETARWYDGFSFPQVKHVYNPYAVVNAMLDGGFDNYWTNTTSYESLKEYISMNFDGLKDRIVQMLSGGRCPVDVNTFQNDMTSFRSRDDVLTVLIHLGYLAYDAQAKEAYVPNEEVRSAFAAAVKETDWTPVIQAIRESDRLLRATWNRDKDAVAEGIERVHQANASILQYNNENALSCVIALAYYNAVNEYTVIREAPAGKGYADLIFLPRRHCSRPAMIVELKYNDSAESALKQIQNRQYPEALKEYQGNLLLVGINYNKKDKKHSCLIEEWEKQ